MIIDFGMYLLNAACLRHFCSLVFLRYKTLRLTSLPFTLFYWKDNDPMASPITLRKNRCTSSSRRASLVSGSCIFHVGGASEESRETVAESHYEWVVKVRSEESTSAGPSVRSTGERLASMRQRGYHGRPFHGCWTEIPCNTLIAEKARRKGKED